MSEAISEIRWTGRTGPFVFRVNPGVFAPTHTSKTIAEALEVDPEDTVIDVGCGSGVLSFVAARLGAKRVVGCDISEEAVEMARLNATRGPTSWSAPGPGSPTRSRRWRDGSPMGGPAAPPGRSFPRPCSIRSARR